MEGNEEKREPHKRWLLHRLPELRDFRKLLNAAKNPALFYLQMEPDVAKLAARTIAGRYDLKVFSYTPLEMARIDITSPFLSLQQNNGILVHLERCEELDAGDLRDLHSEIVYLGAAERRLWRAKDRSENRIVFSYAKPIGEFRNITDDGKAANMFSYVLSLDYLSYPGSQEAAAGKRAAKNHLPYRRSRRA